MTMNRNLSPEKNPAAEYVSPQYRILQFKLTGILCQSNTKDWEEEEFGDLDAM